MGVLAIFDAEGTWEQTHVCDHLLEQNLQALGVRWGRQEIEAGALVDVDRMAPLHRLWGTRYLERLQWPNKAGALPPTFASPIGPVVHWVQAGTLLIYLQAGAGHVGVLCEAGEWLAIPAGLAFAVDAGDSPGVDLLVLSDAAGALQPRQPLAVQGLPSHDAFVETMLEMTGFADDE